MQAAYRQDGRFAILHDMTNCLRIGDITVFSNDGSRDTIEIKSDPDRSRSAQQRRINAANLALASAAPLPGRDRRARLFDLDVEFRTRLDVLDLGTARAARDGIFTARIPGERALLVSDIYGCSEQGWTEDEFADRLDSKFSGARRRAGLGPRDHTGLSATSMDSVSRDPQRVPFAAYPLHPVACARLIGDLAVFSVETSGTALTQALNDSGLRTRWVRPPEAIGDLAPGEVVMEISVLWSVMPMPGGRRAEHTTTLQMRRSAIDQYLIEMVDQAVWVDGMKHMLADPQLEGRQWPTYKNEHRIWR